MIPTLIISIITFVAILASLFFFPKLRIGRINISTYWVIALIGALILLSCSLAPIEEVFKQLIADTKINPLKILVLFFSMTLISIFLDEFGLFNALAELTVRKAKGNQYILFFAFYGLVALLTIFTSNDIVILTFTPFICFFCKRGHLNPLPYLIAEFTAANTWSLMLIIGNPTNIFLATSANIDFIEYVKVMALPTLCAGIVELGLIFILFRKKLKEKISVDHPEKILIENKVLLVAGIIHLLVCLVFLVISSYIKMEMWLISAICALSLLVWTIFISFFMKKSQHYLLGAAKRLPYPLIPFFLSMFVIVVAFNYQGISSKIASFFGTNNVIWIYGYSSFIASNLINNIPMSILYSSISSSLTGTNYIKATYASIVGSNIGAFLTPMGALAGIMFTSLLNEHKVKFSFSNFIKYGTIISIPTISVALLMLFVLL